MTVGVIRHITRGGSCITFSSKIWVAISIPIAIEIVGNGQHKIAIQLRNLFSGERAVPNADVVE